MHFQITHEHVLEQVHDILGHDIEPEHDEYTWALVKVGNEVIARGPHDFATEQECRSNIATAKKSMKGAGRARVLSPGEEA